MQCENCGTVTKHSKLCRDCLRFKEWHEQKPDILHELYPLRIVRKLKQLDIQPNESDMEILKTGEQGLYIYGPTGTGKTLYACECMARLVAPNVAWIRSRGFVFTTVESMLERTKDNFNKTKEDRDPEETLNKYKQARYLLLDDLGMENLTDWVYLNLYSVINHRYDHLLPTIFTSNLDLDQIVSKLDDERVPDRIYEMCGLVPFEGKSKR